MATKRDTEEKMMTREELINYVKGLGVKFTEEGNVDLGIEFGAGSPASLHDFTYIAFDTC